MNLDKDRQGFESPLVHRPTPTDLTDWQVPAPHTDPELETVLAF